jgi:hypothetical protein
MAMLDGAAVAPHAGSTDSCPPKAAAAADNVAAQLHSLKSMSIAKLRIAWRRLYRAEPPKRVNRELLTLAVAWKIQEQAYGGLAAATRRRLAELAAMIDRDGDVKRARIARIKPGARLVREWQGETYTIVVADDGFMWQGRHWQSLSAIAREITGVRWSGPRFFGLKDNPNNESRTATAEPAHA